MSKYDPLWKNIRETGTEKDVLTFSEIKDILGFEIDHSFLTYKKELKEYGYEIIKISLKDKKVFYKKFSNRVPRKLTFSDFFEVPSSFKSL